MTSVRDSLVVLRAILQTDLDASNKLTRERFLPEISLEFHSGKTQSLTLALSYLDPIIAELDAGSISDNSRETIIDANRQRGDSDR